MHSHQPQDIPPWPWNTFQHYSHLQHSNYESVIYTNSRSISAVSECYLSYSNKRNSCFESCKFCNVSPHKISAIDKTDASNMSISVQGTVYLSIISEGTYQCSFNCQGLVHLMTLEDNQESAMWQPVPGQWNVQNVEYETLILHTITVRFIPQRTEYTIPTVTHSDY
jgi:hypothetical protein